MQISKPKIHLSSTVKSVNVTPFLDSTLDPTLLQAARSIYDRYYEVHSDERHRPVGVAIDRFSLQGKLIFSAKPILLPQECFVSLNQLEGVD